MDKWKNLDYEPPTISANWIKKDPNGVWDALTEGLANWHGCTGAPLTYVVRSSLIPPLSANDPTGDYPTIDDELMACMPIIVSTIVAPVDVSILETSALSNFENYFKNDNVVLLMSQEDSGDQKFGGSMPRGTKGPRMGDRFRAVSILIRLGNPR